MNDVVDMAAAPASDQSGFRRAMGLGCIRFLQQLHGRKLFGICFEIGTDVGRSLAPFRSRSAAVAAFFRPFFALTDLKGGRALNPVRVST